MGLSIKITSLICIVIWTTVQVFDIILFFKQSLVINYAQKLPGDKFLPSTAIVLTEFGKLLTCLFALFIQTGTFTSVYKIIQKEIINKKYDTLLLLIPAGLYTLQNYLMYFS